MLQRTSAPPRGPRHSSPSVRGASRGGIQKRRAPPTRPDRDGDVDMDGEGGGRRQSGKGRLESSTSGRSQGAGRGRGGAGKGNHQAQAIMRGMGAHQANVLESRTSSLATLRVDGLHQSKAASNSDRGLEALLGFLERKASSRDSKSNRTVRIKKVCLSI